MDKQEIDMQFKHHETLPRMDLCVKIFLNSENLVDQKAFYWTQS